MNTLKQKRTLFAGILLATLMFSAAAPFLASARGLVPCGGYTDATNTTREHPCGFLDLFSLVALVTDFLVSMAGVYAVYKIIDGGFGLIISTGNEEKITQRKGEITDAVVGLVLVFMAYMLINTVVNALLTRSLVVTSANSQCALDLKNPQTYLNPTYAENKCSNLPDSVLHISN
jgi:hypothetical protein